MIELLCGPIASGKSTYARKRAETGAIIINDDAIVLALHGGNYELYRPELKPIYKAVECTIIHTSLAMGKQVIIDRTNHTRNMRARYITIAKSLDYQVNVMMFDGWKDPKEMAYRRFMSDNRGLSLERWREVATRHLRQLEWPNRDEGFTEVNWRDDEFSPYCEECGSCGESGCCPPSKCKYFENYLKEHNLENPNDI